MPRLQQLAQDSQVVEPCHWWCPAPCAATRGLQQLSACSGRAWKVVVHLPSQGSKVSRTSGVTSDTMRNPFGFDVAKHFSFAPNTTRCNHMTHPGWVCIIIVDSSQNMLTWYLSRAFIGSCVLKFSCKIMSKNTVRVTSNVVWLQ